MRKKIIAANWKMNMNNSSCRELLNEIKDVTSDCDVVVCPPFTMLGIAHEILLNSDIKLGAQNMHFEEKGAYTGEISADMLIETGVSYVIIGHSERRSYFAETDTYVNKKALCALEKGLTPIICVGETLEQREKNTQVDVVVNQVKKAITSIEDISKIVIAYEPIWAIGTGKTATPQDADNMCKAIRDNIPNGNQVSILYGGSMNEKNVTQLMDMDNIDGGLIGSASLVGEKFIRLMTYNK